MRNAILLILLLLGAGCAGPAARVQRAIDSEPQGALVFLDGQACGHTPTILSLSGEQDPQSHILRLELEGHRGHQEVLQNRYIAPRETAGAAFTRGMVGGPAPQGYYDWPESFLVRMVKQQEHAPGR